MDWKALAVVAAVAIALGAFLRDIAFNHREAWQRLHRPLVWILALAAVFLAGCKLGTLLPASPRGEFGWLDYAILAIGAASICINFLDWLRPKSD